MTSRDIAADDIVNATKGDDDGNIPMPIPHTPPGGEDRQFVRRRMLLPLPLPVMRQMMAGEMNDIQRMRLATSGDKSLIIICRAIDSLGS